jgi:rRNA-processing protein FCF1
MAGVVFDSTFLIDLFNPKVTGDQRAALDHLITGLSKSGVRILIPSPCLTELLIRADKARDQYVQRLSDSSSFEVIAYDRRAATECAILLEAA